MGWIIWPQIYLLILVLVITFAYTFHAWNKNANNLLREEDRDWFYFGLWQLIKLGAGPLAVLRGRNMMIWGGIKGIKEVHRTGILQKDYKAKGILDEEIDEDRCWRRFQRSSCQLEKHRPWPQ